MAFAAKHSFTSAKADGTDASLLKPSDWNANHVLTCATNVLLGRASAGAGVVEEIPTSAAMIALLASADLAAFIAALGISPPTTGDGKVTLKVTADPGWLMMDDGTFGNAGSGGTNRANIDCLNLFTLVYNNLSDANAQVQTSGGVPSTRAAQGSAATAWAALCRLALPKQLGRAFVAAGSGSGLTARALGSSFGGDTTTLIAGNIPPITSTNPTQAISVTTVEKVLNGPNPGSAVAGGTQVTANAAASGAQLIQLQSTGNNSISVTSTGTTSTPASIVQASTAWNVQVKL